MTLFLRSTLFRHVGILGCAAFGGAIFASAQTAIATATPDAPGWSSSQSSQMQLAEGAAPANPAAAPANPAALPAAPAAAGQESGGNYSGWHRGDIAHRLTFEAGGGFNAPIGNDTNQAGVVATPIPVITFGGNFTLGAGVRFSKQVSALMEYQFMDNKLPGVLIAAVNSAIPASAGIDITAGNTHINAITASPVIDLFPKKSNGLYLVGGMGWYHKSTNFQTPEAVISYYGEYEENVTVSSFTSNQWGGNIGFGLYHRLGGMYGEGKTQIFAESRYTYIHTPPPSQSNGLGTTELIPVTFGVRF